MSFTFLATKSDTLDYYCYLSHQIEVQGLIIIIIRIAL